MNYGIVRFVIGRIMLLEAALLFPSLIVGFIYAEGARTLLSFVMTMSILAAFGLLLSVRAPEKRAFYAREGLVIVALAWLVLSLFGSLPFVFSGSIPSFTDAFFETASGFTTTGASILNNPETLPHSLLFWRSFTHLIGGMGVLVLTLAILPRIGSDAVHLLKAEVPGPIFGKLLAKVRNTARILYVIYLVFTAILVVVLVIGKMPLFDAFIHAFGTAGTGGFSNKMASVGHYNSVYIETVLSIAMLVYGVNFNLYYLLLIRKFRLFFKSEELRWYLFFVASAIVFIGFSVWPLYETFGQMFRAVLFTVAAIITTTGFSTANFDNWPLFAHIILLMLMFFGAMAGSTGGGIKTTRVAIYIKTSIQEVRRSISPHRRLPIRFEGKTLDPDVQRSVVHFFTTYIMLFILFLLIVSLDSPNFTTAFSAVAATINNIGPGLDAVGPTGNYTDFSHFTKITLCFSMLAGRLELFPILILFSPRTWRKV